MTENTKIEWTDHTINFWWGCEKVSPGCTNCYAEGFAKRVGNDIWGKDKPRRFIKSAVGTAMKLNAKAKREGVRYRVFCQSMADLFEEDTGQPVVDYKGNVLYYALTDLRELAFKLIDATPYLDWLIVTKRPENIRKMWVCPRCNGTGHLDKWNGCLCGDGQDEEFMYRHNVHLLTSVENQEQADKRIPELLKCRDLVPVLGLSMEPLLGAVDLSPHLQLNRCPSMGGGPPPMRCGLPKGHGGTHSGLIQTSSPWSFGRELDWVIVGGESGHNARPMHPNWVRSIRDQCAAANVPFLFKQWGEWYPLRGTGVWSRTEDEKTPFCWIDHAGNASNSGVESDRIMIKVGKKSAGRLLDGVEHSDYPEVAE